MLYTNPDIESFYKDKDLGKTFYDTVLKYKPKKIIEFGPYFGYSTVVMAMALDELGGGHITSYDLFEKYEYKHPTFEVAQKNIDASGLSKYITLQRGDLYEWIKNPEPFDLLYVDISNNGEVIDVLYDAVKDQIAKGSIVIFEGGSEERDNVAWMKEYKKKKFKDSHAPYTVINPNFPSLSMISNERS